MLTVASLFKSATGSSQSKTDSKKPLQQLVITHDNDFLLGTDTYYSAGLLLTYHKQLQKGIFSKENEQLFLQLAQQVFTPSDIDALRVEDLDRPYAGYLSIKSGWSLVKNETLYATNLEVGLTGPYSGAGTLQMWFHDMLNYRSPNWFSEIGTKIHANIEASTLKEFIVSNTGLDVFLALQPVLLLGTKDRYLQQNFIAHFGKRSFTNKSSAYNQLSTENEFFFTVNTGVRYVAYNDLLVGVLTENSPALDRTIENWVTHLNLTVNLRRNKNSFLISYVSNSPENLKSKSHSYISLSYGRNF